MLKSVYGPYKFISVYVYFSQIAYFAVLSLIVIQEIKWLRDTDRYIYIYLYLNNANRNTTDSKLFQLIDDTIMSWLMKLLEFD